MGFGRPVIKEGIILVISIVTLQNYFGDLGEVYGKYPGWVKVPGPFDIWWVKKWKISKGPGTFTHPGYLPHTSPRLP